MNSLPAVELTVYPFECDNSGQLNAAACLALFERARWDALARGPGADVFHRAGVLATVRRATLDCRAPAYAADALRVETVVAERTTTGFTLRQRATRAGDTSLIAEAEIAFECLDRLGRPAPIPEDVGRVLGAAVGGREVRPVRVHGGDLAVEIRGEGAALLLVHGFPLDRNMWRHQLAGLSRWRRIAPDLRGFGASSNVAREATGGELRSYADDLVATLDALGVDRAVVCGLSMGGYVAFELLRRHADRVRALILMDTRAEADTPEGRRSRDEMAELAMRDGAAAIAERMLPRLLARATAETQPETVALVRGMIERAAPVGIAAALRAMRDRPDSRELLGAITVPVLALGGSDDELTPPAVMQAMTAAIPGAHFAEVPAAGHLAPLEQPLAVNGLVSDFLERLPAND